MRKATQAARCWTLILSCLLIAGCGSNSGLARVKGKVTLNGQPLEGATVTFQPTAADGSPSSGVTDADGRYELMFTFDTPGAMPGEHVVSIGTAGTDIDDEGYEVERPERVPAKYNRQTTLKRTVKPGRNTIDFPL
jgi:hypothetical protein